MNSIFKVGDQTIQPGRAWKDSDGTLQPKNWQVWSADEKKAAGISEIIMQPLPDQTLYSSSHNADGSVNSTARPLADTVRQTQARNSDGAYVFLDPDNKEVSYNDRVDGVKYTQKMEDVLDADGNKIPIPGVKTNLKNEVKKQQASFLFQTDWAIVRKADKGTAIPSNIQTWRDAIRTKATEMETAIDNAADTAAIEALFIKWTTDSDGKTTKSGILYDWPELGS